MFPLPFAAITSELKKTRSGRTRPLAIYHLTAKIVDRKSGRSVVGAAAYRAGERIKELRTGTTWDFTHKPGVEHREILASDEAPEWVHDRTQLWNTVDKVEKRKDAQLARDLEIALPTELDATAQVALLRDYLHHHFVSKGMIADCAIHRDNPNNPHAHVLLTMRNITQNGFGLKERSWNSKAHLQIWRRGWEEIANAHLTRAGLSVRIDHRTLEAQRLDLIPGRKIGVSLERQQSSALPHRIAERVAEQRAIAAENGSRIISDPKVAIQALAHYQSTFAKHDIAKFLHTRTDGAEQFRDAYLKVTTSPELVVLGKDDRGHERYTSREMLEAESEMLYRAELMTLRTGHSVAKHRVANASLHGDLSGEQRTALNHLIEPGDLKALAGVAGSGKSHLAWQGGTDPLTSKDILVVDETGMVGTRQLARLLEAADQAKAKVVLIGDPEQRQAIEAGGAFRGIIAETGVAELDGTKEQVTVDTRFYGDLDHGYAATPYKAQGATVDRTYVVATPHLDRDDNDRSIEAPGTDMDSQNPRTPTTMADIDALQQRAAEKWLNKHLAGQYQPSAQSSRQHEKDLDSDSSRQREIENRRRLERPGPGDDLEI